MALLGKTSCEEKEMVAGCVLGDTEGDAAGVTLGEAEGDREGDTVGVGDGGTARPASVTKTEAADTGAAAMRTMLLFVSPT